MRLSTWVTLVTSLLGLGFNPSAAQTPLPRHAINQLRQFVGSWTVEQVLWRPGFRPDTTHLDAVIEFSRDTSVLIVRESSTDGRFQFVGYHTFDSATNEFVNWGAASDQALGWARGVAEGPDVRFTGTVLFLTTGDTLSYTGLWHSTGPNEHIYDSRSPTTGQVMKKDVYRRKVATH